MTTRFPITTIPLVWTRTSNSPSIWTLPSYQIPPIHSTPGPKNAPTMSFPATTGLETSWYDFADPSDVIWSWGWAMVSTQLVGAIESHFSVVHLSIRTKRTYGISSFFVWLNRGCGQFALNYPMFLFNQPIGAWHVPLRLTMKIDRFRVPLQSTGIMRVTLKDVGSKHPQKGENPAFKQFA